MDDDQEAFLVILSLVLSIIAVVVSVAAATC